MADSNRLTQLTGNLISNALTYGQENTPVTITSSVAAATCAISVHNEGLAIPAAIQTTVFEPMTRGPGAAARGGPRSVGLGLFIVREIARAHHGNASVVSKDGMGTTFMVDFPQTPA